MNCLQCSGACCETFSIRDADLNLPSHDVRHWVRLHAIATTNGWLEFRVPCSQLHPINGSCRIYEDRPQTCRDYKTGGQYCIEAIQARRTPGQYAMIRDAEDPSVAELYGATERRSCGSSPSTSQVCRLPTTTRS